MTDRSILFSAPMVRALLEGRKTQTRRILKPQPFETDAGDWGLATPAGFQNLSDPHLMLPYAPGDRLWCREAFSYADHLPETVWYWADGNVAAFDCSRPKPSIHMPRWASRLTLIVEGVKVERLNEISEDDATAEGWPHLYTMGVGAPLRDAYPIGWFGNLWERLHGPGSWDADPWVAAISFRVIRENIDRIAAKAEG